MSRLLNAEGGVRKTRIARRHAAGTGLRAGSLVAGMVVLLLAAVGSTALEESETVSVPLEVTVERPMVAAAEAVLSAPGLVADLVSIGLNFQSSELGIDSGSIPPDTMGAVGPDHIVEMINGNFQIFDKSTGTSVDNRSLNSFWTNIAGVTIPPFNDTCNLGTGICTVSGGPCAANSDCRSNGTFDPRIVYDIDSGRWFAASLDRQHPVNNDNNIYVARSDTSDPTGDWDGLLFDADTVGNAEFHDYDTLAVDADGVYICTQDFGDGGNESCYSIPKADLLQAVPTVANMTRFEATPANLPVVGGSIQPAVDFGPSDGRAALLGVNGGSLVRGDIIGANAAGATLGPISGITGDPGHAAPPDARQPHPNGRTIENVAPRFVSNVFELGDSLWAVHAVQGSFGNSALRWYEIDEVTNTVLQTALIEDPDQDFHEPSIVANEFGNVVIGYTCSGPTLAPAACVSVGETTGGTTTFDPPILLQPGDGHYYRDFPPNRNRWGDYSATVLDPVNPCTFWTFQEFVAVSAVGDASPANNDGEWGIQITELTFTPPVLTVPGDLQFDETCVGSTSTATLNVCNTTSQTGVCAHLVVDGITSSNGQFEVVEPSSGFPVVISPDLCFPFQVRFTPTSGAATSATLTIESSDPENPSVQVTASGTGGTPDIRVIGSPAFGNVCPEDTAESTISVCNVGSCNLNVASAAVDCADFTLVSNPFPAPVSPDSCLGLIVRFTPTGLGPKVCALTVTSNDPDTAVSTLNLTGNTPSPAIDVPPDQAFLPTVIQSVDVCEAFEPFPVSNTGQCQLTITNLSITNNADEYSLSGLPSFPIILAPGHVAGDGDLNTVFAPDVVDRARAGAVSVTYVSDPINGTTTTVDRDLCGEGVRTGARVLVTEAGVPIPEVKSIRLHRINANRNKTRLDTVDNVKDVPLTSIVPAPPCQPFDFHREYGTASNPIQLLPGAYEVNVQVRIAGRMEKRTVGFDVNSCGFNPTIIVDF